MRLDLLMKHRLLPLMLALMSGMTLAPAAHAQAGKAVYERVCAVCHATGIAGAPKYGNAQDWAPRAARGTAALYKTALEGNTRGMPPRGGHATLSDADVKGAVDYMLAAAKGSAPATNNAAASRPRDEKKGVAAAAAATGASPAAPAPLASAAVAAPPPSPATSAPAADAATVASGRVAATTGEAAAEVNAFNRLLRAPGASNPPPARDGIHDPQHDGTLALQPPLSAFELMPRAPSGNRVNWVAALHQNKINPRWDRTDPKAQATVMDLNIVREVKGTMPNVVFPHKQHTEWLDCSNCHPAIFIPQKGANQISMAAILLGQKCGVCHGKVAFPVSECRLCHAQKKELPASMAGTGGKP